MPELSEEIENILANLSSETERMLEKINSIDSIMNEQESEISSAKSAISKYFTAITELTDNIESQSASVTQTSRAANEIAVSVKNDLAIIREIEKQTGRLSAITDLGSSSIDDFVDSIKKIEASTANVEEILRHISELSDQIDILAMNAAIEAAHAGEAGKGFAVVADEVKRLSENSAEETAGIADQVRMMRDSVSQGSTRTKLADRAFGDIRQNVEDTTLSFREVIEGTAIEEAAVDELLTTVKHLVHITDSLKTIAAVQQNHNDTLKELLETVFGRFGSMKSEMEDQRKNRENVGLSLKQMQKQTGENLNIVSELEEILKQFKY